MRVAALITGGKDSTLALHRALRQKHEVKYLVTMIPQRKDSWMFHSVNIHLADLVAEAVGIPLVKNETSGVKEVEVEDLKDLLATLDIDGVVSGAILSAYQKTRIDTICRELNLKSIAPLWCEDPIALLKEMISLHFETIFVGVYAYGFDESWLGRRIDSAAIQDLVRLNRRYQVSAVGEGGEYETLVLNTSFFEKRIKLLQTEKVWENQAGHLLVKRAELVDKD
ncbi:MAG: TIGR00289 family protein [Candidatus Bathyarchaeota archaeon]|nr:MAG: TIGR00289 family protein [Candidatus Bathyarchaeota archaeon]